jgi:lipoate-protein ligase A
MKNIHVLPTDKPSRLHEYDFLSPMGLSKEPLQWRLGRNIYITSDEEDINENDYIITADGRLVQVSYLLSKDLEEASKVILTTDQDLIKDGVQAIDDEFLEWFVKNPSCEEVEVEIETTSIQLPQQQLSENSYDLAFRWINKKVYKIIIPQEEPKDLAYWKENAEEDYMKVPISVLRYITELEERMYSEVEVDKLLDTLLHNNMCSVAGDELIKQFKNK